MNNYLKLEIMLDRIFHGSLSFLKTHYFGCKKCHKIVPFPANQAFSHILRDLYISKKKGDVNKNARFSFEQRRKRD